MDSWKAKAAAAQASLTSAIDSKRQGHSSAAKPSTPYAPSRPHDSVAPSLSASERAAKSSVLTEQRDRVFHRPLPPPRRNVDHEESESGEAVTPPAVREQTSGPPVPPARNSPAVSGGGPAFKPLSQYTLRDKSEFFDMLDEFFSTRMDLKESLMESRSTTAGSAARSVPTAPLLSPSYRAPSVTTSTRPPASPTAFIPPSSPNPDPTTALSVLQYILHDGHASQWYSQADPTPPLLAGRNNVRIGYSIAQRGTQKTLLGMGVFADASALWFKLDWSTQGNAAASLKRDGRYRPSPSAWEGDMLYEASEKYGPLIVTFAETALAGGQPIGTGECWDLAAQALESVGRTRPDLAVPFPSTGYAHGHLLYNGTPNGGGLWRGGDAYVRAGDIVQWKSVHIKNLDVPNGICYLGAPDHTAIIISADSPTSIPSDGDSFPISDLVSLSVIEQSPGEAPKSSTYDMTSMTQGEVWIYRPVGFANYCGSEVAAVWPPTCESFRVDEL